MLSLRALLLLPLAACGQDPAPASPAAAIESSPDPGPLSGPMDFHPARRTVSPTARWTAQVDEDRGLSLQGRLIDAPVDPRVAFAPDETRLVYARADSLGETDLWQVDLPTGSPTLVLAWPGSQDRPVLSPDGRRLAFVSGHTGIAAWWTVRLDGGLPVPLEDAQQLSNVDLVRRPGQPPDGWLPVPTTQPATWDEAGLHWVAQDQQHDLAVPE